MSKVLVLLIVLIVTSCSSMSVYLTPTEVKQAVANATAIANLVEATPLEGDDLQEYLKLNAASWRALSGFYGLCEEDE